MVAPVPSTVSWADLFAALPNLARLWPHDVHDDMIRRVQQGALASYSLVERQGVLHLDSELKEHGHATLGTFPNSMCTVLTVLLRKWNCYHTLFLTLQTEQDLPGDAQWAHALLDSWGRNCLYMERILEVAIQWSRAPDQPPHCVVLRLFALQESHSTHHQPAASSHYDLSNADDAVFTYSLKWWKELHRGSLIWLDPKTITRSAAILHVSAVLADGPPEDMQAFDPDADQIDAAIALWGLIQARQTVEVKELEAQGIADLFRLAAQRIDKRAKTLTKKQTTPVARSRDVPVRVAVAAKAPTKPSDKRRARAPVAGPSGVAVVITKGGRKTVAARKASAKPSKKQRVRAPVPGASGGVTVMSMGSRKVIVDSDDDASPGATNNGNEQNGPQPVQDNSATVPDVAGMLPFEPEHGGLPGYKDLSQIPALQGLPSYGESPGATHEYHFWDRLLAHIDTNRELDHSKMLAAWNETKQGSKSDAAVQKFVEHLLNWSRNTGHMAGSAEMAQRYYTAAINQDGFLTQLAAAQALLDGPQKPAIAPADSQVDGDDANEVSKLI